jgi:hypothetical protein
MREERGNELAQSFKGIVENEVEQSLQYMQALYLAQANEATMLVQQTAKKLKCDESCVSQCCSAINSIDRKGDCLDICLCLASTEPLQGMSFLQFEDNKPNVGLGIVYILTAFLATIAIAMALYQLFNRSKQQRVNEPAREYLLMRD